MIYRLKSLLAKCEFFEYLTAFHVGREHQTLMQSIYTLSQEPFRSSVENCCYAN